ncbi:MAG: hypothetical protein WCW47_00475 [Candidatus Paceibacterota bacterium]|jgi:hypothetical protein
MSVILTKITSALSGDLVFLVVVFAVLFICAMYFGKNQMVSIVLSFYPATLLYNSFPFINKFIVLTGEKLVILNKVGIFLIFFVIANFAIRKYISSYNESSSILKNGGLAFAVLVLLLLFSYSTVSLDIFHNFSGSIDVLFVSADRVFWWNLAPLAILIFI